MKSYWIVLGILLATNAASSWIVSTEFSNICSRVRFPHRRDIKQPHSILLSGVYVRTSYVVNDFPVYQSERSSIYFYRRSNYLIFSKSLIEYAVTDANGPRIEEYAGLGVDITYLSSTWTRTADNFSLPFGSAISKYDKWFAWIPQNSLIGHHISANYDLAESIMPVCVSQTVSECGYGRPLFFNVNQTGANGVSINNPNIDEFVHLPDVYRENRPVYKHSNFAGSFWYLFYRSYYWNIGPDYNDSSGFWYVVDNATKPELITAQWQVYKDTHLGWVYHPASMLCRGRKLRTTCSEYNPCLRGKCYNNPLGETVCACPWGWTGVNCETSSPRCGYVMPGNVGYVDLDVGTMVTLFCPDGSSPVYYVQQCQKQLLFNKWISLSECQNFVTVTSPVPSKATSPVPSRATSPAPRSTWSSWNPWSPWSPWNSWNRERVAPFNADTIFGLYPSVIILAVLLPIILPFLHWQFLRCIRKNLATDNTGDERKVASFNRVNSMHLYFGLVLWVVYLALSVILHLRDYGRSTFYTLNIIAFAMIAISYVAVLVESRSSYERKYLSEKFTGDGLRVYFMQLFSTWPVVSASISCFHYETRSRVVYYTDANGNSRSGIQTYQVRVNTYTESQIFHYASCRDISNWSLMPDDRAHQVTTIKLTQDVRMADADTQEAYNRMQSDLLERNRQRDAFIDCTPSQTIPNFKERIMAYDPTRGLPWWMNLTCYWISAIFWCTWPFRWCMGCVTKHDEFTIVKEVSIHPNIMPQQTFPPMVTIGHVGPALSDDPGEVIHMVGSPSQIPAEGVPLAVIFDPSAPFVSRMYPPYSASSNVPDCSPPPYAPPNLSRAPTTGMTRDLNFRF